jgi:hypothetical protein
MSSRGKYHYVFWVCFAIGLTIGGIFFGSHRHAHGEPRTRAPVVLERDGEEIVFYNPNFRRLSVTLDCGKNVERPSIELYPRVSQKFRFSNYPCRVVSWRKAR